MTGRARAAVLGAARVVHWRDEKRTTLDLPAPGNRNWTRYLVEYAGRGASLDAFIDWTLNRPGLRGGLG